MINLIVYYLISLITIISFVFCFKQISEEKLKIHIQSVLLLITGSAISILLLYLNNSFGKNIFTIVFLALIFKTISTKNIYESFYYSLLIWIYGLIVDLLNMLLASITGLIKIMNLIYVQSILTILIALMVYIFCSLPPIKKFSKNTIAKLTKLKPYLIIDFIFIFTLILISTMCFANLENVSSIVFYILITLIIIYIIYSTVDKHYSIKRLKEVNHILIKNNEFFMSLEDEHRILKHNLINQLIGIKSISTKEVKEVIDDLISNYAQSHNVPKDINKIPEGINGIIYEKFYNYNNSDIQLVIDNTINTQFIDNLKPKTFNELCESLGVIIDNAFEATLKSDEKIILINFWEDKEHYYIEVNNTFKDVLDIDCFGNKNYSTKVGPRGIGIFSILKRTELTFKTKIINNCFINELKIKKSIFK